MICEHPYITFRREIDHVHFQQKNIEDTHYIRLYEDRIETAEYTYEISMIFDMSYKMLSGQYGFFYLHTTKGVMTFQIKENPEHLIHEFRKVEIK
ncbi:hypothetical protein [Alkalibacillus salilacus]|uniref:Uncharacterized protein n=1 Tax=Alkalibacillus salilacus TaxID=284582 RepID=A0ABT9VE93_9BACI|nr:hypothetical protein [Alkalibacillus salilacus]MDQ0159296.1 hypothetical protein [Alkalibacillus salilacus]